MISRIIKCNFKIIIAVGLTAIICISGTVFATGYFARDISYKKVDGTELSVEQALNELYSNINEENLNWTEVLDGLESNPSYQLSAKLYKCGKLCKITFVIDNVKLNTDYKIIVNPQYYPKEEFEVYGWGFDNGMANVKFKTDGNIVITSQSIKVGSCWSNVKNIIYVCE